MLSVLNFIPKVQMPALPKLNNKEECRTSVFYINDFHGCESKMANLNTAADFFTKAYDKPGIDTFKMTGGDIYRGKNKDNNLMWVELLNKIGLDFAAIGNHEFDAGAAALNEVAQKANFKYVCSNVKIPEHSKLQESIKKEKIVSSYIANKNGNSYGIVGLTPTDSKYKEPDGILNNPDIKGDTTEESLKDLQKEVNHLQQKGINKIFLVSHFDDSKNLIPKTVSGIDVIISGHKHRVYDGIIPGQNLFSSPAGEPVIKVEGGRDGNYNGVLDIIFDKNGKIKNAKNTLYETEKAPESFATIALRAQHHHAERPIGILINDIEPSNFSENPIASFAADSIRKKSGADIAFISGSNITERLEGGIITDNTINKIFPFKNNVLKVKMTEKDIVKALQHGTTISDDDDTESRLLQVSGLRYTIGKDKNLKEAFVEKNNGKFLKLNTKKPSDKKTFTVAYDKYMLKGHDGFTMFKKEDSIVESYDWCKADAMIENFKNKHFIPQSLKADGRIKVEK